MLDVAGVNFTVNFTYLFVENEEAVCAELQSLLFFFVVAGDRQFRPIAVANEEKAQRSLQRQRREVKGRVSLFDPAFLPIISTAKRPLQSFVEYLELLRVVHWQSWNYGAVMGCFRGT